MFRQSFLFILQIASFSPKLKEQRVPRYQRIGRCMDANDVLLIRVLQFLLHLFLESSDHLESHKRFYLVIEALPLIDLLLHLS